MIRVKKENHRSWFMSNYYPCEFVMNGIRYKNAEAAFQSHKVPLEERRQFADMPPASAKRGTQYARFAFFRTANRLNQYYKTATGQRVAKRVNNGDFPYNVYDANGGIVKPETKKTKKAV